MLLAIDAGNTQTVLGLFPPGGDKLAEHWRISTNAARSSDEHGILIGQLLSRQGWRFEDLTGMVVSSTVPRLTTVLREMAERYGGQPPVVVGPGTRSGMPILIDNPKELGADRLANAVAAYDQIGGPAIVVDFGTATTVDAVSADGEYLGGAIMPGIEISLDALFQRAAALPRVDLAPPNRVIGKSTVESVRSGMLYGFVDAVDGLCRRFRDQVGECPVIATGGLGGEIAEHSALVSHYEPWLTLHGLRVIYERNADAS